MGENKSLTENERKMYYAMMRSGMQNGMILVTRELHSLAESVLAKVANGYRIDPPKEK